jgi:hypothetical protein
LVHFMFIWYIFPVLVPRTKKNLATLVVWRPSWDIDSDQYLLNIKKCGKRLLSQVNIQIMHIKSITHDIVAMFTSKSIYPGGIRTRLFCWWGGCDVHCAKPPGPCWSFIFHKYSVRGNVKAHASLKTYRHCKV